MAAYADIAGSRHVHLASALFIFLAILAAAPSGADTKELLNVSYDPTRELYQELNPLFAKEWKARTGEEILIRQSHGGSGKQARLVTAGLEADVLTLALAYDIDLVASKTNFLPSDWQTRFPNNSCPYTSTIVFLVRKGNPKGIKDWDDLVRADVQVITPNPKTSGGARWNYLAAWGYALLKHGQDEGKARGFVGRLYNNVPILDTGARGSTNTFLRGIGDVLLAWENEALLVSSREGAGQFEVVVPSVSVLAEPAIALVDRNTERHGTSAAARAYLEFLYSPAGQEVCAKNFYRPIDPKVMERFRARFPEVRTFTVKEAFGGWWRAHQVHFAPGGVFDHIYE